MNKIYRLIWSRVKEAWVVVAEKVSAKTGIPSRTVAGLTVAGLLACSTAHALPQGGQVAAGSSTISRNGSTMQITQTSDRSIINWQGYGIGAGETVRYSQPSASAISLNRVTGADPSVIAGQLSANGRVWVINPNGLLVGNGARIETGSFLGSTLNISDSDFMNGSYRFSADRATPGGIANLGSIAAAEGGTVMLIAPSISNQGSVEAPLGKVYLASGSEVTLTVAGNDLIGFTVNKGVLAGEAGIDNSGLISANGGEVILSAKAGGDLLKSVVNNSGVIEARTVENRSGRILLLGDMESGTVQVNGKLDASAPEGGNGGFVETSAAHVKIADSAKITTAAAHGLTGSWLIDPVDFTIAAGTGALTTSGIGATTLSNSLNSSNVSIATDGSTGGNGDIFVNAPVSWAANTLKLIAHGNIYIDANLNGSGAAKLYLAYGQQTANGNGYNYFVRRGARVNLLAGANFTTEQGYGADNTVLGDGGGTTINWTVITGLGVVGDAIAAPGVMTLQGMNTGLAGNYVLGADIDASGTSTWIAGAGFMPVGRSAANFTGSFDGLGHTITGLTINRPGWLDPVNDYQGLFGYAGAGSKLRNVGLLNSSIYGGHVVGALAGRSDGDISNSYADGGSVTASVNVAGGLVGALGGSISNSYANVSVSGANAGGAASSSIGGLVGSVPTAGSSIGNSYATGSVSAGTYAGGLVGQNRANITNSYATGAVSCTNLGPNSCGGLIGDPLAGTITASYWDSATTGRTSGTRWGDVAGLTDITAAPKAQASYAGFDFAGSWRIYEGQTRPLLKSFLTPLTVTATGGSRAYDGTTNGLGVTYSVTPNANLLGTATAVTSSANAGTYTVTPTGLYSNQRGYDIAYADGTLTVDKAHLTVTADNQSRLYGQANPTFSQTITGYVNGENATSAGVTGSAGSGSSAATALSGVGSYTITGSTGTLNAANYDFTAADGTLTIDKAHLTVTADNQSRLYGQANPTFAQSITGFVNGENATSAGITGAATGSSTATVTSGVGNYTIAGSTGTLAAANYDFTAANGTLTIDKAHLTVTADNQTRLYGQANPTFTQTISGYVNGENATSAGITGSANGSSAATTLSGVGSYTITGSTGTLNAANYDFIAADGTLTINKAHLTVTANNQSRLYGQANPMFGQTITGYVNGENATSAGVTGSATGSSAATATSAVGSYAIAGSTGTLNAANYDFIAADGTLTINKAHLTVTADNQSRLYGQANPMFGQTITGFVNGENATSAGVTGSATGSSAATATSAVGTYAIAGSTGTLNAANYDFTAANGTLTIDKANATVTANSGTTVYNGQQQNVSGFTATGLVNGETESVLTGVTAGGSGTNAGTYATVASGTDGNYNLSFVNGSLTINKANATVTANSGTTVYNGQTQQLSGFTATGLVNGETAGVLTGVTAGGSGTNAGTYTTVASGTDGNYNLSFVDGTLAITPAPLTITAENGTKNYDGLAYRGGFGVSYSGFVGGETAAVLGGTLNYGGSSQGATDVGRYAIVPAGLTSGNYTVSFRDGVLDILPSLAAGSAPQQAYKEAQLAWLQTMDGDTPNTGRVVDGNLLSVDDASYKAARENTHLLLAEQ